MGNIIGGLFTSHVPSIGNAIVKGLQQEPYWKPFFDGFIPVRRWLNDHRPDVAVVFYNDHGLNFFLDTLPTFAVGAAAHYRHGDEGWGLPEFRSFEGAQQLSWHIINTLVEREFDVTTCQEMLVDHGFVMPFELCWPDGDRPVKVVPIEINTVLHPLPSPKRCLALGRAVGEALASWPTEDKILVIGTGGLSHQLDGSRAGFINKDYDLFCLDTIGPDPDALTRHSSLDIVELAGSQGIEILNWIAARGALGDGALEVTRNYHVPISNTAAATLLLEQPVRQDAMPTERTAEPVAA